MERLGISAPLKLVCLGAGGHAVAVIGAIKDAALKADVVVLDADTSKHGSTILGVPVVGGDDKVSSLIAEGFTHFLITVGVVRPSELRAKLFAKLEQAGLQPFTFISPSAIVSQAAQVGAGSVIMPGAIVNALAQVGRNTIINTRAVIEHESVIADHVHIAPGAVVLGAAKVEMNAFVGAGAVIKQQLCVGEAAMVAAGAVVVANVDAHKTVKGVPARYHD